MIITELPKHRIEVFQELVKNEWNIDLNFDEAGEQAKDFFNLMELIRLEKKYNKKNDLD